MKAKRASAPAPGNGVSIGAAAGERFTLTAADRSLHVRMLGGSGKGKSKALELIGRHDIDDPSQPAVIRIDPHGTLFEADLAYAAWRRPRRPVLLLNPSAGDPVLVWNPFLDSGGDSSVLVDRYLEATVKSWGATNTDETPRLERWLRNLYHVIVERGLSIAEAEILLDFTASAQRRHLTAGTTVEAEWRQLDQAKTVAQFEDQIGSTKNRLQRFYTARTVRRFLGLTDPNANLDLLGFMDAGGILLVNLKPSPHLSPMNARLFGTLLVTKIFEAARRRELQPNRTPRPCYVTIDEAQNFLSPDVSDIIVQGRKMGLSLTLAHQTLAQAQGENPQISAALNACQTQIAFGLPSNADAVAMTHELFPGQIDLNEIKRTDYELRFRPIDTRETTYKETWGGGTTILVGKQRAKSTKRGLINTTTATVTRGSDDTVSSAVDSDSERVRDIYARKESEGIADAKGQAVTTGEEVTEGETEQSAEQETWTESTTDVPVTKHEPYEHPTHTLYTLEEQRQRRADELRCLPPQVCIVRLPTGKAHRVSIDHVAPVPLSQRRVAEYAAERARKTGAFAAADVDRMIQQRTRDIDAQAQAEAATDSHQFVEITPTPLHSTPDGKRKPLKLRPNPALNPSRRKKPPEGTPGEEG